MSVSRILIISNMFPERNPKSNQAGIFVKEQAEATAKLGPNIHYYFIDGFKSKLQYLKSIFSINHLLWKESFDIIHIHYGISGLFLLFNFFTPKNKIFLTLHGSDISPNSKKVVQKFLSRKLLQKVGTVIVVNKEMREGISSLHPNIRILPCGVNTDFFSGAKQNTFIPNIIFPSSRERPEKNFPLFLEAFKLIKNIFPNAEYTCFEQLNRESVKEKLLHADILLLTSSYEGSPQVIKEALSCNLPIVSTSVGDVNHLLQGINGCHVCQNPNAKDIAHAAIEIIKNKTTVTNGKERLLSLELDNDSTAKKLLKMYDVQ